MSELQRGKLKVTRKGKRDIVQVEIDDKLFNIAQGQLSADLTATDGLEVEFIRVAGQPREIRPVGQPFKAPVSPQASEQHKRSAQQSSQRRSRAGDHRRQHENRPKQSAQDDSSATRQQHPPDFHNPYNFIPAPPREKDHPELGDHATVQQGRFCYDRFSGRIRVEMVVQTPLLVPDTDPAKVRERDGHKTFEVRTDAHGLPLIPSASIRGMLRSAYEAVTNSRFGRFSRNYQNRLAFRMDPRSALGLIPAHIESGQIRLLTGTADLGGDGRPNGPMYAAWLPRYWHGRIDRNAVRYGDGSLPQHGDQVDCWIELIEHHNPRFRFWRVRTIVGANGGDELSEPPAPSESTRKTRPFQPSEMRRVRGWVCITNANINRKHDERVFFRHPQSNSQGFTVAEGHRRQWRELIENYQSIHEEDLNRRRRNGDSFDAYLGDDPGRTAWSRHVYTAADKELSDGTLCYVRLSQDLSEVAALFPVMISRELYPASPLELLDTSLRPAASVTELSPADRVFGWIRADAGERQRGPTRNESVARRGLLRVGPVFCESSRTDAVEVFDPPGVPLAILAAPKPQQGRFYIAQTPNGDGQDDRLSKIDAGYSGEKGLRGRKVYPHQRTLPLNHWNDPAEDRTQEANAGHYQEYRRPHEAEMEEVQRGNKTVKRPVQNADGTFVLRQGEEHEQRDDQNRSILGWVRPGARFSFDIHVENLSAVELGALFWSLSLPNEHYFRFGGGKPLGFGSVQLSIRDCDVCAGTELRAQYMTWNNAAPTAPDCTRTAVDAFKRAVVDAYSDQHRGNGQFERVSFIAAFLAACRGFDDNFPIHYPRATANRQSGPANPLGESFKWFVANEDPGNRYALRDLAAHDFQTNELVIDTGLPTLREKQSGGGDGRGRGRRRDGGRGRR